MSPNDDDVAEWLAAETNSDSTQVKAELETGERRRAFIVDELLEAGYEKTELLDLVAHITGLDSHGVDALIAARTELHPDMSRSSKLSRRDVRLAANEIRFRQDNEQLVTAEGVDVTRGDLEITCECSDRNCSQRLTLAVAEYEWLRQNPWRFAVLPGHEAPAVEAVVERHAGFVVIEKNPATHDQAEASDPRP